MNPHARLVYIHAHLYSIIYGNILILVVISLLRQCINMYSCPTICPSVQLLSLCTGWLVPSLASDRKKDRLSTFSPKFDKTTCHRTADSLFVHDIKASDIFWIEL